VVQSDDSLQMAEVCEVVVEVVQEQLLEELAERFERPHCDCDPKDLHPPV
jgi:hypothetical protein